MLVRLLLLVITIVFAGCSTGLGFKINETYPGVVTASTSDFDGLVEVRMKPGFVYDGVESDEGFSKVGARWTNREGGFYVLTVQMYSPDIFEGAIPLRLKVNGKEYVLEPVDKNSFGTRTQEVIRYENEYGVHYSDKMVNKKEYYVSRDVLDLLASTKQGLGRFSSNQGFVDFSMSSTSKSSSDPIVQAQLFITQIKIFLAKVDEFSSLASTSQSQAL